MTTRPTPRSKHRKPPSPTRARPGGWSPITRATPPAVHGRTRASRTIASVKQAVADPDRTPAEFSTLAKGTALGWVTLLAAPSSPDSPVPVRCLCGAASTPRAGWVADGTVRSCGNVSLHGLFQ